MTSIGYLEGCLNARNAGSDNQSVGIDGHLSHLQRLMIVDTLNRSPNKILGLIGCLIPISMHP